MADPLPPDVPFLAGYMRVQRGLETAQDLINAFPALEQAVLNSSSASGAAGPGLTEQERRRLVDLPDAEEEAANIRHVSTRSRAELVSTALSSPGDLSEAELELLGRHFWANVTSQETETNFYRHVWASEALKERVYKAFNAAHELAPLESPAYGKAAAELSKRRQRREDEITAAQLGAHQHHTTPAWMNDLARRFQEEQEGLRAWGFIALYDNGALETTSVEDRDLFERTVGDVLRQAMTFSGAKAKAIARRWRLHFFDAPRRPSTANTTTTATGPASSPDEPQASYHTTLPEWLSNTQSGPSSSPDKPERDHVALRSAFGAILDSPEGSLERNILYYDQGVRTDMFLVVNKECIDSVIENRFLDDMRILAYEANFPPTDRSSDAADGYEGWTWVRLEQLVYRFYAAACTRDDIKMHDIWRAAQASRHKAFVSLDPEVAQKRWTNSTTWVGQREPRYDVYF